MKKFENVLTWLHETIALPGAEAVLISGTAGALLTLFVLGIHLFCRRWLTISQMMLLWGLVLVRMALPLVPDNPLNINQMVAWSNNTPITEVALVTQIQPEKPPAVQAETSSEFIATTSGEGVHAFAPSQEPVTMVTALETLFEMLPEKIVEMIPLVWLGGALFVLFSTLWIHWRFIRQIARVEASSEGQMLRLWRQCCQELGIQREIPVVICEEVKQPAVMGIWRPKLLLPSHWDLLNDEQQRLVMLHELMHIKHFDVAVNWLMVVIKAAQWWNPFFWFSQSCWINLREQSRDAMVLRFENGKQNRAYGELLLLLASRGESQNWRVILPASLLGFLSGWALKLGVANRLKAMAKSQHRQNFWHRSLATLAIVGFGLMGLTDAKEPIPNREPIYSDNWQWSATEKLEPLGSWGDQGANDALHQKKQWSGEWTSQQYDITSGIAIISQQTKVEPSQLQEWIDLELSLNPAQEQNPFASFKDLLAPSQNTTQQNHQRTDLPDAQEPEEVISHPSVKLQQLGKRWIINAVGPGFLHQQVQRMVQAWNRSGRAKITSGIRIATTREDVMEKAGLTFDRVQSNNGTSYEGDFLESHPPLMVAFFNQDQARRFIETAQHLPTSNILFAPLLSCYNGQEEHFLDGEKHSYIVGMNKQKDGQFMPQVQNVLDGICLTLQPELIENRSAVDLSVTLQKSKIKKVQHFSTRIQEKKVTIQVPNVEYARFQMTERLNVGQTLLLCLPPTYEDKMFLWILLTPTIVP